MKTIIGIFLLILAGSQLNAQQTDSTRSQPDRNRELSPEQRAIRKYRLIRSEISLDEAQAEQVKKALIQFEQEKEQIFSKLKKGTVEFKTEMKRAHEQRDRIMNQAMGQEKFSQWEKIRREKAAEHRSKGGANKPAPGPAEEYY